MEPGEIDCLTAATSAVLALVTSNAPPTPATEIVGWPERVSDIEKRPWVEIAADYAGVDETTPKGDWRIVAVDLLTRADAAAPANHFWWVESALGRSRDLPAELSDSVLTVKRAEFDPPSSHEQSADWWERLYRINLICQVNCT